MRERESSPDSSEPNTYQVFCEDCRDGQGMEIKEPRPFRSPEAARAAMRAHTFIMKHQNLYFQPKR